MKTAKGWVQGDNAQAMVTEDQIIIAGALTQDANDVHQLDPMVTAALVNLEIVSGEEVELGAVLADAGYWCQATPGSDGGSCVDGPAGARRFFGFGTRVGCGHVSGLFARCS